MKGFFKVKKRKLIIIGSFIFLIIVCTIFFSSTGSEENKIVEITSNTAEVSNQTIITTLTAPQRSSIRNYGKTNFKYKLLFFKYVC